jgi:hypothetical protein
LSRRATAVLLAVVPLLALAAAGYEAASPHREHQVRPPPAAATRETFSVAYTVTVLGAGAATADVRWDLAGIDEVERVRFKFDPERFGAFEGSGTIERRRGEVSWWPSGPYAHLRYTAALNHRHAPGKGYDSYAGDGWVLTRTSALFPRSSVSFRADIEPEPESRGRLIFRLPAGWDAVTAMPPTGRRRFIVESSGRFDHPRGWLMLGRFRRTDMTVGGTAVTIAATLEGTLPPARVLGLLEQALPVMSTLFGRMPARLLIAMAPDPMWRGGLSGEESFYMHGNRPLQTPDRTSPYLHELFHVVAPFRPAPDAHWVTEGLAELYTLEVQRRIGRLDGRGYAKALRLFARYGLWGQDFTRNQDCAIHNNSAPLVLYALDRRMREVTSGKRGLDDVVGALAAEGGVVSTARLLGVVRRLAGKTFDAFFRQHVYRGERPPLPEIPVETGAPASRLQE